MVVIASNFCIACIRQQFFYRLILQGKHLDSLTFLAGRYTNPAFDFPSVNRRGTLCGTSRQNQRQAYEPENHMKAQQ